MITDELWGKLASERDYRREIVSSMLKRGTAMQIQGMMKQREWTQAQLAEKSGLTQGVISRAANPAYGNLTFNTVIDIAAGFDVAFIGRFVPFSEFARWVRNLRDEIAFSVSDFETENSEEQEQAARSQASAEETQRLLSAASVASHPFMGIGALSSLLGEMVASPPTAAREGAATTISPETAISPTPRKFASVTCIDQGRGLQQFQGRTASGTRALNKRQQRKRSTRVRKYANG